MVLFTMMALVSLSNTKITLKDRSLENSKITTTYKSVIEYLMHDILELKSKKGELKYEFNFGKINNFKTVEELATSHNTGKYTEITLDQKIDAKEYIYMEKQTSTLVRQRTNNLHRGTRELSLRKAAKVDVGET